jgi:hypothetical protein
METEIRDKFNNRLFFVGSFAKLQLAGEKRVRILGEVRGDTFVTFRDLELHEMHNRKEIGFNLTLIRYEAFRKVSVITRDGRELQTTKKWILKYGHGGRPGKSHFEVQIFLALDKFCGFIDPPEVKDREPCTQGNSFHEQD